MKETIIDLTYSYRIDEDYTIKANFFINPSIINEDLKVIFKGEVYKIIDWTYTKPLNEHNKTMVELELYRLNIWNV